MNDKDLFTPQELMDQFPFLKRIGWSASKIGILVRMGLVDYKTDGRKVLIFLDSFKEIIDRRNRINHIDLSQFD